MLTDLGACLDERLGHLSGLSLAKALLAFEDDDGEFLDGRGLVEFLVDHVPRAIARNLGYESVCEKRVRIHRSNDVRLLGGCFRAHTATLEAARCARQLGEAPPPRGRADRIAANTGETGQSGREEK